MPKITEKDWEVIRKFTTLGFAVVMFTPDELKGADPLKVEEQLVSEGWEIIEMLASEVSNA